ncbi:ATP-binding protein [bacterium]|nr:ATP-binding protein [bacterium]
MRTHSFILSDSRPELLTIEYSARFQIPGFQILGLPAPEIQEARERIASAFQNEAFEFPKKKITINLSPASLRKSGTGHDLAIALKIMSETVDAPWPECALAWGELSLDGTIRSAGKIAHLIELLSDRTRPGNGILILLNPFDFQELQRLLDWRKSTGMKNPDGLRILRVPRLREIPSLLASGENHLLLPPLVPLVPPANLKKPLLPLSEFQERMVKLASIGRHHALIMGPKGVGKSASFDWFRTLAEAPPPPQAWERALFQETRNERAVFETPIRQVHSQVKPSHLMGTYVSNGFRAGELSLAHGGILFADEFPEWPRDSKECLREPLETEKIILTRVKGTVEMKCDVQIVASGNLCPCGGFPALLKTYGYQSKIKCRCLETEVRNYLHRISGPILDRIDLVAVFGDPEKPDFAQGRPWELIHDEVKRARDFALELFQCLPSKLIPEKLEALLPKRRTIDALLREIGSLRSRHKVIRVACTIQSLEGCEELREEHLIESRAYRFMDQLL